MSNQLETLESQADDAAATGDYNAVAETARELRREADAENSEPLWTLCRYMDYRAKAIRERLDGRIAAALASEDEAERIANVYRHDFS